MSAEDAGLPALPIVPHTEATPEASAPRGRLFRKYVLFFVGLVAVALLVNSGFDFWFGYQENKAALVRVQQEKAAAAAQRIAEFVDEIERQIGWTTHAEWSAAPLDQRRFDYVRLLSQVPAITEISELDKEGKEQLKVSRLAMDVVGSNQDFSKNPAFTEAKAHKLWFSPVYFRKESEPYMTLAMARAGRNAGVTIAEVNLKLIWDVITALKIGQGGYAYVVDQRGKLIAHPDISLVLRDTDFLHLPQVAAALNQAPDAPAGPDVTVARNNAGASVLSAHATIPQLGWLVFVEVPLQEAYAPLYGAALRGTALLLVGLLGATLAALILARRMTGPIRELQEGAARIGAGALDRRIEIHTGDELEGLANQFNHMAADLETSYAELEHRVEERTAELAEALDQQTATAEVLGVINASPGDLAPVFDAILDKAHHLCGASHGVMALYENDMMRIVATYGVTNEFDEAARQRPLKITSGGVNSRLIRGEDAVQVADLAADTSFRDPADIARQLIVDLAGARTGMAVALRKDGRCYGAIWFYRREVRLFTEQQIALLKNFAAQAVIAMENARLITETREALDQQTATAEVLGVINASPGNLAPVFDAMLEKAMRLCDAQLGFLLSYQDGKFGFVAGRDLPPAFTEYLRVMDQPRDNEGNAQLATTGVPYSHMIDLKNEVYESGSPFRRAVVDLSGARTGLGMALRKDGRLLGTFNLARTEARAFSEKQIALVENFAAQAVIAIENARLITETQEALDQQTATAEVLGVINSSPGNLTPVFEAMLEKAMRLCDAALGAMFRHDGARMNLAAMRGLPLADAGFFNSWVPGPGDAMHDIVAGARLIHIPDIVDTDAYRGGIESRVRMVEVTGARTALWVPLRKDDALLGVFVVYRSEVRPFTDKQVALIQNFAAQAVIAIENARLITETQEALDQQTATAEVLQVINAKPGELQPVFDVILEKAMALCDVAYGDLELYDGETFRAVATRGLTDAFAEQVRRGYPAGDNPATRPLVAGERVSHIPNMAEADFSKVFTIEPAADEGHNTLLCVPLRRENALLGMIACARREVRAFSDKEITLLESFAAQAVIAMENARLITETQEALEQQTATAEVLGVINSSPGNLTPVWETILERAIRLCRADQGDVFRLEDGFYRMAAAWGFEEAYRDIEAKIAIRPDRATLVGRVVLQAAAVQIVNVQADPDYGPKGDANIGNVQTMLGVPLLREGVAIGVFGLGRQRIEAFSEREVALVTGFAQQAVIAIENERLLDEIRQRQAELRVTFDNMADGVVMFDDELRLAAWNKNFQEILDLPDKLLEARKTYAEYLHILAERGEFGPGDVEEELSRRLAHADEELRYERTRPNGQILEVRRNSVAGGGFVLIYSDITERKRSEEEIRAARDAAEKTLGELKTAQASLIQAEKMASLGQLTAGIAHEIKNPLNFVNNFAHLSIELLDELKEIAGPALDTLDKDKRADLDDTMEMLTGNLDKIGEHGRRADNIVKSMLEHSRGVTGERREVDLNALIEESLNLAYHGARAQDQTFNITLERDFDAALKPIELVPQDITRVFLNLFGNGFYAANKRARANDNRSFRPVLRVATHDDGAAVEIKVRDNGTGIPADIRDKLFQPFFTTKPTGEGTGLGLSISYDIVTQQHGGSIGVDSEEGSFTEFTIRLPRNGRASLAPRR